MKKSLLVAAAALIAAGASASDFRTVSLGNYDIVSPENGPRELVPMEVDGSTRAGENSMKYSVAVNPTQPYTTLSFRSVAKSNRIYQCFEFTPANLKLFKGGKITSINITTGGNAKGANTVPKVNVYMSNSLGAEPFYKQTADLADEALTENVIELEEPYEITDDSKSIFIGYYFMYNGKNEGYLPVDGYVTTEPGAYIAMGEKTQWPSQKSWDSVTDLYGSLCISVTIEMENLPTDVVDVMSSSFDKSVKTGGKLAYKVLIRNKGANDVKTLSMLTEFGATKDEAPFEGVTMKPGGISQVPVEVVCPEEGIFDVIAKVSKVNGNENKSANNTATGNVAVYDKGFDRNVLLEEGTGGWCGFCPAGIVMMDNLKENYPFERFIPIAIHNGDRLEVAEYQNFLYAYISGFPGAVVNRVADLHPTANSVLSDFKTIYDDVTGNPAYGKIDVEASVNEEKQVVEITGKATLAMNCNSPVGVSFVVVQDHMGPYDQANYFSGGGYGPMGGWANKDAHVDVYYDDVAVAIKDYPSIPNALPKELEKDKEYTVTCEIPMVNKSRPSLSIYKENSETFRVVAILNNLTNGEVINSSHVKVNNPISGVEDVEIENADIRVENGAVVAGDEDVEVYTLDGRRARNSALASGLYIVKAGNRTAKVLVK